MLSGLTLYNCLADMNLWSVSLTQKDSFWCLAKLIQCFRFKNKIKLKKNNKANVIYPTVYLMRMKVKEIKVSQNHKITSRTFWDLVYIWDTLENAHYSPQAKITNFMKSSAETEFVIRLFYRLNKLAYVNVLYR